MKISIMGTNGFLSTAIAKYANKEHWALDMYGLDTPVRHKYDNFYKMDSDIVIYAIGAGIQANLQEDFNLIYNLNVTAPVNICNKLKELDYKGIFVTFGSVFEMGETKEERFFTEEDVLTSLCPTSNDYTVSKRMLSKFVASYKHGFRHWHFYIPTIYGAGENPKRLIPYVINAIRNGEELHFTAGETLTVKEIVTLIHQAMGKQVPEGCFGSVQRADVGMKYLALDGKKLKNTIGFEATVKITDTIDLY